MQDGSPSWTELAAALTLIIGVTLTPNNDVASSPASRHETSIDELISLGIRHNAEGDYDTASEVWSRLGQLDPEHPAANVYAVETLYWRMMHTEDSTRFDDEVSHECNEAIRKAEAWVDARPDDALGHFYLGQALMHSGRLHGMRARIFKAWRLGERGRRSLERTLELDPGRTDAKLPIGLYYYYASLVPDLFNWLNFLWFVPTGNGDRGIAYMEDVARNGVLHRVTAEFHLAHIRSEHRDRIDRDRAHSAYRSLHSRYPTNALVHFQLLESLEMRHDFEDLILEARMLEAHPGPGRQRRGPATMARVWRARGEMMLHQIDDAWETLSIFGEDGPEHPDWGRRWVKVTRAQLLDVRGQRDRALDLYRQVLALDLDPNFSRETSIANEGVEHPFELGPTVTTLDPDPRS